ncbi:MAG: MFS transporter [Anaerolineaceae bacterium]|nr:MFS transporter [Anaerolineaceae bacterium]
MENKKRNQILFVLFLGVLMGAMDIAIVGPALPAIRSEFQISERLLAWIFSIYVLFNLISTPLMAKLSDMFGRRTIYIIDIVLFAIGSLVVAMSNNFGILLIGRAIQGFGAGGIFPVASAVIGDTFPPEKRGSALGLIGAVFGLAFIIGPILGAVMMSVATWHWLFFINLPLAVLVIFLGLRVLPTTRPQTNITFDWQGMLVLAGALASFAYGINQLDTANIFSSLISRQVFPFLVASGLLIAILIPIEKKAKNPVLPGKLFNRKQLGLAYAISAGAGVGEASLVFLPLLAVVALSDAGITERSASFLLMPVVIAMVIGSPTVGRLLDKFGSRLIILSGSFLLVIGMFLLSQFADSLTMFIVAGIFIGFGLSALLGAPIRYIMLNESDASERSTTQGVATLFTSIGQLVGSAFVGAIAASRVSGGAAAGYAMAFLFIAGIALLLVFLAFSLKNRARELADQASQSAV